MMSKKKDSNVTKKIGKGLRNLTRGSDLLVYFFVWLFMFSFPFEPSGQSAKYCLVFSLQLHFKFMCIQMTRWWLLTDFLFVQIVQYDGKPLPKKNDFVITLSHNLLSSWFVSSYTHALKEVELWKTPSLIYFSHLITQLQLLLKCFGVSPINIRSIFAQSWNQLTVLSLVTNSSGERRETSRYLKNYM